MLSVRHILIYLQIILSLPALTQQAYKGVIYDVKSRDPVPYATIRLIGKQGGMIANEDGRYYLPAVVFLKTDTVLVSCVGYNSRKIPVRALKDSANIGLHPMVYDLKEVNIVAKGQPDYLYRMYYDICQKYRKTDEKLYAKAYFSFLSECNGEPLELIEAYFNASVSAGEGISQLTPKNGRIGLTLRNFWSLNTTDILKHLFPFTSGGHHTVPMCAGNFSYHRFKELYYVNLIKHSGEGKNINYVLRLVPKSDSVKLFESIVYLNEYDNTIDRIENSLKNIDFYYLRTPIHGDRVDSVNVAWSVTFDNSDKEHPKISRMSLDYSLLYIEKLEEKKTSLSANAELLFYDFNKPYLNTLGYLGDQPNDYQRIMSIPYDSVFWMYPGITPESRKQSKFRDFFRSNGVLLNYSPSLNSFVRSVYIPWAADRNLEFYELGTSPPVSKTVYIPTVPGRSDPRKGSQILGLILINPVEINDSLHLSSVTLVNARGSYMNERQSYRATAFINVIFDLYELKRRETVNRFHSMKYGSLTSWNEFKDLYGKELGNVQDSILLFYKDSWEGTNVDMIVKWSEIVSARLGVKRTALIQRMIVEDQDKKKRKRSKP
ncbi:MAG: carboxypeptidase-like regulatory domain-containing protein [Bacteroidetes bacterium]|nr:carboxypeptidase-like regulatory domain-containing protein [Bacteroidota bacterium]